MHFAWFSRISFCNHALTHFSSRICDYPISPSYTPITHAVLNTKELERFFLILVWDYLRVKIYRINSSLTPRKSYFVKSSNLQNPKLLTCNNMQWYTCNNIHKSLKQINSQMLAGLTSQKMKFSIKDFFCKCDEIRSFLRIWSHLLKKSLKENFIFCSVSVVWVNVV